MGRSERGSKVNFYTGGLLGGGLLSLGFGLGGGTFIFPSAVGYALVAIGLLFSSLMWREGAGWVAWFFFPTAAGGIFVVLRGLAGGGGSWVGWQDLIAAGGLMAYFVAAQRGTRSNFLAGVLLPLSILGLVMSGVIFLQAAGHLDGHPLHALAPGFLPQTGGAGGYMSSLLPTRTASAAALNAMAMIILGQALWGKVGSGCRIALLWSGVTLLAAGILCQSRAGVIGLAAGIAWLVTSSLVVAGRYKSRALPLYFMGIGGVVVAVGGLLYLFYDNHWGVRGKFWALFEDPYRLLLWGETISQTGREGFLWGLGPGGYHQWSRGFSGRFTGGDPVFLHNDWIQFALEYGWVAGVLLVAAFAVHLLWGLALVAKRASGLAATWDWPRSAYLAGKVGAGASLASIGAHAFFDYPMHTPLVASLAGFAAGICAAGGRRGRPPIYTRAVAWAGVILVTLGVAIFPKALAGDFVSWKAERLAGRGDVKGGLEVLMTPLSQKVAGGRDSQLAEGNLALTLAQSERDPKSRARLAKLAGDAYSAVLLSKPGDTDALRGLGISSLAAGNYGMAERLLRESVARSPNSARAYEWLGFCLESQGRTLEAMKAYRISIRIGGAPLAVERLNKMDISGAKSP
jgi:hypothetical protein